MLVVAEDGDGESSEGASDTPSHAVSEYWPTPTEPSSPLVINSPRSSVSVVADGDRFEEALRVNRQHWRETGRPASAETLRKRLRMGAEASRALARAVRAVDRAAVSAAGPAR